MKGKGCSLIHSTMYSHLNIAAVVVVDRIIAGTTTEQARWFCVFFETGGTAACVMHGSFTPG